MTPALNIPHENIPADAYHAAPGVSNSMLKHFARSPRHYQHALYAPKEPPTPAMELGTLFHLCVLEPDKFPLAFHVRPDGMKFTTKEGKAWQEAHMGLPIITREQHANMLGARDAIFADPTGELLMSLKAVNEVSLWVNHAETGLLLKSRFDRLAEDGDGRLVILDLKTTDDARFFETTARNYRYDIQSEFYRSNLILAGHDDPKFVFIAVELEPPFGLICYEQDEDGQKTSRDIYEAELQQLAQCEREGNWPGYFPDGIKLFNARRRTP